MTKRSFISGTTLLELLVSLAIMAMIAVVLTSLLSSGRQVWARSDVLFTAQDEVVTRAQIRQSLEAMPLPKPHLQTVSLVKGTSKELVWLVAATSLGRDSAETLEYKLAVSSENDGRAVLLSERELSEENAVIVGRLSNQADGFSISYYRWDVDPAGRVWTEEWLGDGVPRLIKISLVDPNGNPLPPLTVEPGKLERQSLISLSSLLPPG